MIGLSNPAPTAKLVAGYGKREPIKTSAGWSPDFHRGLDFALGGRSFPVLAAAPGRIRWATTTKLGGLEVLIEHDAAIARAAGVPYLATRSGHLARFAAGIRAGARVDRGQVIGWAGSTGRSDGVHLHWEIYTNPRLGLTATDPTPYMATTEEEEMALTATQAAQLEALWQRIGSIDNTATMVSQLWDRRATIDAIGRLLDEPDNDTDESSVAREVVDQLGPDVAARIADELRAILAAGAAARP